MRGDVDVLAVLPVRRVLRHHEAEAAGIRGQTADDEVHLVGQAKAIAANLEELAGRDQRFSWRLNAARSSRGIRRI